VTGTRDHQFALLYQDYHHKVLALAGRICLDAAMAQDLTQDVFLKVYQKLGNFRGESNPSTWLYAIAVNHCLDHMRREQVKHRFMDLIGWQHQKGPDEEALARCEGERVLKKMSLRNRTLLVLKVYLDLDYREIGKLMNMTPASVGVQLTRARREAAIIAREEGTGNEVQ